MARQQDTSTGRQRLVALGAVASLVAVTGLAFGRVFVGHAATWELVAAALTSILLAGLCERRGLAVALLVSLVGLAFALTWIVLPQTAWYGLPTLRTLRAVGRCMEFVAQQARVQVAPTPAFAPLLLAAVTAIWTAAFSTHALAIRSGSPLLAILPSVALVGFADTVLEDGARPIYAIAFLVAALGVVFVDGLRRVRQWGPIWSSIRGRRLSSVASRGARQVALIAVATAVLVPWLLPGFRSEALVDFSTSGDGVGLDPFVSIQAQLDRDEPIDLFRVTSPGGPAYWRLYALDRFNGTTWSSSDPRAERGAVLQSPARLPVDVPVAAEPLVQRYRILRDIHDPWVPMAYPAEIVTFPDDPIRYNPDLASAVHDGGLDEGLEYTVESRVVEPTPEQLDLVRFQAPEQYGGYTFLPASVDPQVREVAQRWAGPEATPYRQVLSIQNHLTDTSVFTYSLDVEPVSDADALLSFLTSSRTGFCQQFATAMAVLVRELGYPARVVVGFRSGTANGDTYVVTSKDAHAWVEVFFPAFGWLPFEPTPGRPNPAGGPGTYLDPTAPSEDGSASGAGGEVAGGGLNGDQSGGGCTTAEGLRLPPQLCRNAEDVGRVRGGAAELPPGFLGGIRAGPGAQAARDGYSIPYRWILLGLAVLFGAVLVFLPVTKWVWRRRTLRRSRDPRELALAAYRVFDGEAADLGLGRREGETVQEHRARLSAAVTFSNGHLSRLARVTARAAYAPDPPSRDDAEHAVADAREAIADLRKDAGWGRRIVGTYRPGF